MSGDRIQRQIEFIVENQAKFSEDILKLDERLSALTLNVDKQYEHIANLTDAVLSLTHHVEDHDRQISALIEDGKETDRQFRETDKRFEKTDERLNALIKAIERLSGGRSGGGEQ